MCGIVRSGEVRMRSSKKRISRSIGLGPKRMTLVRERPSVSSISCSWSSKEWGEWEVRIWRKCEENFVHNWILYKRHSEMEADRERMQAVFRTRMMCFLIHFLLSGLTTSVPFVCIGGGFPDYSQQPHRQCVWVHALWSAFGVRKFWLQQRRATSNCLNLVSRTQQEPGKSQENWVVCKKQLNQAFG